jgi:release factor glutamine methyltransferase
LLAEQAVQYLQSAAQAAQAQAQAGGRGDKPVRVLDFGTGSGCLAIVIATRCPEVLVHAVERSEAALAVARENAARHGVTDRIQFHCADGLEAAWPAAVSAGAGAGEFALVVSNPPYLPTKEIDTLQPEVRDFDPRIALDGGEDGLDFYRMLARSAAAWLKPGAPLMVELAAGQAEATTGVLKEQGWRVEHVEKDYDGHERILIARQ